jgi:2-polyprenyl-3-methyl-5-hydroxy-6-metoxy-1,4-benzoquinol methylase
MTFGSRFAGTSDPLGGGMPLYRFVGNRVTTTLENLMLGARFTELHSGLRAYTRRCLLSLPFLRYTDDFSFDSQLLVDAVTSNLRVVEVPIPTRYTKESSSISIPRSLRYVTHSLTYCAKETAARGRRGRRSPVGIHEPRPAPMLGDGPPVERSCALCGARDHVLLYAATTRERARVAEFGCTSDSLGSHDDIVQCRRCGHVSSVPQLDAEGLLAHYSEVVDDAYLVEEPARRELFDWVLNKVSGYPVRGRRLLEVGSHLGLFLDVARGRGWQARGVEPSRWAVETGRRRFDVDLEQGSIEALQAEPGSGDVIVMLDVLEHLERPVEALRLLREAVDGEGLLALSTVNVAGLHGRLRGGQWPWFIRPHLHYFMPQTLHTTLAAAGFRLVEWAVVPRSFHLSYLSGRLRSRAGERLAGIADPALPVGWLGDVVLAVARPDEPRAPIFSARP